MAERARRRCPCQPPRERRSQGLSAALVDCPAVTHVVLCQFGDGVRRMGEQPGAAHRGRRAASRRRVRVRPPARCGRAAGRRLAPRRAGPHPSRVLRPGHQHGRRRHQRHRRARSPRAWANAWARTTRRRSSCTSTTSPPRWSLAAEQRLDGVFNVAPDGWVAGERVRALAGAVPRAEAARSRQRSGHQPALAFPARPHPARPAQLHQAGRGWSPTTG